MVCCHQNSWDLVLHVVELRGCGIFKGGAVTGTPPASCSYLIQSAANELPWAEAVLKQVWHHPWAPKHKGYMYVLTFLLASAVRWSVQGHHQNPRNASTMHVLRLWELCTKMDALSLYVFILKYSLYQQKSNCYTRDLKIHLYSITKHTCFSPLY